jgi:hypothetical protein
METPLLAIDSPHLREEIRIAGLQPPRQTGVFLLDQAKFFSARKGVLFRLVGGPVEPQMHFTHMLKPWSEEKWQLAEQRDLPQWVEAFDTEGPANRAILERLIQRVRAAGNRIVLLETPLHPRARRACGEKYNEYLQAMQEFADEQDVPFWCLDEEAQITEDDFVDFIHLCTHTSQLRYQTVLMNKIEPVLRDVKGTLP